MTCLPSATLQEQFLDGKVYIFHKRRRKNSRRLKGHRQVRVEGTGLVLAFGSGAWPCIGGLEGVGVADLLPCVSLGCG